MGMLRSFLLTACSHSCEPIKCRPLASHPSEGWVELILEEHRCDQNLQVIFSVGQEHYPETGTFAAFGRATFYLWLRACRGIGRTGYVKIGDRVCLVHLHSRPYRHTLWTSRGRTCQLCDITSRLPLVMVSYNIILNNVGLLYSSLYSPLSLVTEESIF